MSSDNLGFVTVPTFSYPNIVPLLKMQRPNLLAIIVGGTVGAILWTFLDLSPTIGAPLSLFGFIAGVLYVVSAPPHLDAWQWTKTLYAYTRRPGRYARTQEAAEHVNDKPFTTGEETRELTNIEKFYPSKAIIEREDGSLVAYTEVHPPHRDFATTQDWVDSSRQIAQWFNGSVDFEFQLYVTTEAYPIETHLETLSDRLTDSDVLGNRNLKTLIDEQLDAKQREYEDASTSITHFYIVVPIDESEVSSISETDQTAIERLQKVPVIGILFEAIGYYASGQAEQTERETKLEMARKLRGRIQTVQGLGTGLEEYEIDRLGVGEIAGLQRRFWRPTESHASTATMQPRSLPASTMETPSGGDR